HRAYRKRQPGFLVDGNSAFLSLTTGGHANRVNRTSAASKMQRSRFAHLLWMTKGQELRTQELSTRSADASPQLKPLWEGNLLPRVLGRITFLFRIRSGIAYRFVDRLLRTSFVEAHPQNWAEWTSFRDEFHCAGC